MDDDALVEQIRADADRLDPDQLDAGHTDVDALVDRALLRGRRVRTRRRLAGAVSCAVAAGIIIAVLTAVPNGLRGGPRIVPAAPSPPVATSSSFVQTPTPPTPRPPTRADRVSGTPADVQRILTDLLPADTHVTRASASHEKHSGGFAWENVTDLTVHDPKGISYVAGGIGNGSYQDECSGDPECTKTALPGGGTLWITSSPQGDKAGSDLWLSFSRPDGGHIWLSETTYAAGSGPVTRDTLLFSRAAGRTLITSPAWDALFHG